MARLENSKQPGESRKRGPDQECTETPGIYDPSPKKLKVDKRSEEEQHFYDLYQEVLDEIQFSTGISDENVRSGILVINESFDFEAGHKFSDVDLKQTDNICGYLSRYATHSAGLARARIVDAVQNCKLLESALRKKNKDGELRVVSIGGGPGNDALGFCSALSELGIVDWRSLSVTVVDVVEEWWDCVRLVDKLLREKSFGSVSELFQEKKVRMSFVSANMAANPSEDVQCYKALREADIILECKMINGLSWTLKRRVIQALREIPRDDALLLMIHSPFKADLWTDFDVLYAPPEDQYYRLSTVNWRFGFYDGTVSKAQIRVLRKNRRIQE